MTEKDDEHILNKGLMFAINCRPHLFKNMIYGNILSLMLSLLKALISKDLDYEMISICNYLTRKYVKL